MASQQISKAANEKFCFECGSKINSKAEICPQCGVRQLPPPGVIGVSSPNGRNRVAAAIFALLLGGLGIHKFYLGRVGQEFFICCFVGRSSLRSSDLSRGSYTS